MQRGERVKVKAFGNNILERVVWEDIGPGVLVCTEDAYTSACVFFGPVACYPKARGHRQRKSATAGALRVKATR
jgi:hypothetical protein